MLWGVGTGRCGTKSLATTLGGEREGVPCLRGEAAAWARGEPVESEVRAILEARLGSGARAWVDFKHSYCVDVIREVDARAEIVWVIRRVASFGRTVCQRADGIGLSAPETIGRLGRPWTTALHRRTVQLWPRAERAPPGHVEARHAVHQPSDGPAHPRVRGADAE